MTVLHMCAFQSGSLIARVFNTYKLMHTNQTVDFVKQKVSIKCSIKLHVMVRQNVFVPVLRHAIPQCLLLCVCARRTTYRFATAWINDEDLVCQQWHIQLFAIRAKIPQSALSQDGASLSLSPYHWMICYAL